jgi:hypothetical protein
MESLFSMSKLVAGLVANLATSPPSVPLEAVTTLLSPQLQSRNNPIGMSHINNSQPLTIYLLKQDEGLCFNCLAQDHKVAQCWNPTRCWLCYRLGHISSGCPTRLHGRLSHGELNKVQPSRCRCFPPMMMWRPVCNANQAPNKGEAHVLGIL